MAPISAYLVDVMLFVALGVTTLAVVGMYRFDEPYQRLHAASMATFVGVVPLFVAIPMVGGTKMLSRALATLFFLIVVLPVSVHMIGRARYVRRSDEGDDDKP